MSLKTWERRLNRLKNRQVAKTDKVVKVERVVYCHQRVVARLPDGKWWSSTTEDVRSCLDADSWAWGLLRALTELGVVSTADYTALRTCVDRQRDQKNLARDRKELRKLARKHGFATPEMKVVTP